MSDSTENRSPLGKEILMSIHCIMKSHSRHFHVLSILFLLPIFFTLVIYPSFHLAFFHPNYSFFQLHSYIISVTASEVTVLLVYTLFVVLFFLCAVATITYSAVQVSYDRPIHLVSSIKSIRNSFFPLLSTCIVSHTIFISIAMLLFFSVKIGIKYDLNHLGFMFILVIVPVLLWLQVNWSLAYVIAVVESKWGFETLRRSAYLVKGMSWLTFWTHLSNMLIYVLLLGSLVAFGSMVLVILDAAEGNQWRSFGVISQTVLYSVLGFVVMNYYLLGNVATYMYCKDFNGEKSSLEIGNKFTGASEYVSMPLGGEKNHAIV
ncbi:hypothetical protein P3S68_022029 [Capsicum galapagoense]